MVRVAVIMSTYNGDLYLQKQIDTILEQEDVEVEIFVRDDGSMDGTRKILEMASERQNVHVFFGNNLGVGNSFMECLYSVSDDFEYYCFSDQDDIWMKDKLSAAVEMIRGLDGPKLYVSEQTLADDEGKPIRNVYESQPDLSVLQIIHLNILRGCTMVWNKELFRLLKEEKRRPSSELLRVRIHDIWVAMVARVVGEIIYDEIPHILYRQHEYNFAGVRKNTCIDVIRMWRRKLRDSSQRNGRSRLCREVLEKFGEMVHEDDGRVLKNFAYYKEQKELKKQLLRDCEAVNYSGEHLFLYRLKIRVGLV